MKELKAKCLDCDKPYEDFGLDMTLPDHQWLMIRPEKDGLLCANCIVKRASKLPKAIAVRAVIDMPVEFLRTDIDRPTAIMDLILRRGLREIAERLLTIR